MSENQPVQHAQDANTNSDGRLHAGGMQMPTTEGAITQRPAHPMDTISGGPVGPSEHSLLRIPESVSAAGLRERATIMRARQEESCARHLELAADRISALETAPRTPAATEDARSEVDVLRAEANAMSREYALASMAIGRRGDENISLSEQIKQLRDQVERLKASLCQIFDVCENNTASEGLLDQIQEIAENGAAA